MVAPCQGITEDRWALTYMKLRQLANLDNSMLEPGPLLPAPANDGATAWTKRPMSSEEGTGFIRKILDAPKPVREDFQPILSGQL